MKKYRTFFFSGLVILLGCKSFSKNDSHVSRFVLYRQPIESINRLVDTSIYLDSAGSKIYADPKILSLVNNKQKDNSLFLWKGGIYGKIIYQNGESEVIAVSRYGAYFKNMVTGQGYSFKTEGEKDEWHKMINDFFDKQ